MRQVPASDVTPFGIVGNGRVARHFSHYFTLLGLPVSAWSRRARGPSPPEALASCRTILVLIPDAEIAPFIDAWPPLQEKRLVHCSGSLVTAAAEGAHPLMTFGPALYDLSGVVNGSGSPPTAGTRQSPEVGSVEAKTMVPSAPQLAPRKSVGNSQMVDVGPPRTETRLSKRGLTLRS